VIALALQQALRWLNALLFAPLWRHVWKRLLVLNWVAADHNRFSLVGNPHVAKMFIFP
jgi:hypothetical protein